MSDKIYENYIHTRKLDLNLIDIKDSSYRLYDMVNKLFYDDAKNHHKSWPYNSVNEKDTIQNDLLHSKYNVFLFPFKQFHALYLEIQKMFREKSNLDFSKEYYIQAWLNVYKKGEFINWHEHWDPYKKAWHGYYCVECEPSKTTYKIENKILDIENEDNLLVMSQSNGENHRTWPWHKDDPRITIAFDIVPSEFLTLDINHWIPI